MYFQKEENTTKFKHKATKTLNLNFLHFMIVKNFPLIQKKEKKKPKQKRLTQQYLMRQNSCQSLLPTHKNHQAVNREVS